MIPKKYLKQIVQKPNSIKNVTIKPNKAIASVNANPNNAYVNNFFSSFGFLAKAFKNPAKITPIPTPAPAREIVNQFNNY